jgi:hypothetical protein
VFQGQLSDMLFTQETRITFVSLVLRKRAGSSAGNFPLKEARFVRFGQHFEGPTGRRWPARRSQAAKNFFLAQHFLADRFNGVQRDAGVNMGVDERLPYEGIQA